MDWYWYLMVGLAAVLLAAAVYCFNHMITLRNKVRRAWKDIDVQLEKRSQLVPILVRVAEGYAMHERQVLESVTRKRSEAREAEGAAERGARELSLASALWDVLMLEEDYPQLKADDSFEELHRQLVQIEDHLAAARKYYNGAARIYNTYIQSFPQLLLAAPFLFRPAEYFQSQASGNPAAA